MTGFAEQLTDDAPSHDTKCSTMPGDLLFPGILNKFDCLIWISVPKVKSGNEDCPQIFAAVAISANICRNVYKNICPACICSRQMGDTAANNRLNTFNQSLVHQFTRCALTNWLLGNVNDGLNAHTLGSF